jgi:hypothetical protein
MTDNQWDMLGVGVLLLMSVLVLLILFWLVRPAHSFCASLAQGCTHTNAAFIRSGEDGRRRPIRKASEVNFILHDEAQEIYGHELSQSNRRHSYRSCCCSDRHNHRRRVPSAGTVSACTHAAIVADVSGSLGRPNIA